MDWRAGDYVEWESMTSRFMFRGVIEGFYGADRTMCMCTDQTGRGSRPVRISRLRRPTLSQWYTGEVA
jgi:hypothetical protein